MDLSSITLFSSTINPNQRETLERVFFYNKNQAEYYFDIKHLIESYGPPRIVEEIDRLYLNFEKIDCQNIFIIIDHNLVGLAIYYRDSLDNIDLVHVAVDEKYSSTGKYADKLLVLQMINELKKCFSTFCQSNNKRVILLFFSFLKIIVSINLSIFLLFTALL